MCRCGRWCCCWIIRSSRPQHTCSLSSTGPRVSARFSFMGASVTRIRSSILFFLPPSWRSSPTVLQFVSRVQTLSLKINSEKMTTIGLAVRWRRCLLGHNGCLAAWWNRFVAEAVWERTVLFQSLSVLHHGRFIWTKGYNKWFIWLTQTVGRSGKLVSLKCQDFLSTSCDTASKKSSDTFYQTKSSFITFWRRR